MLTLFSLLIYFCCRFHILLDFDEDKRSCRRKLERHNKRRRRKPDSKGILEKDIDDQLDFSADGSGDGELREGRYFKENRLYFLICLLCYKFFYLKLNTKGFSDVFRPTMSGKFDLAVSRAFYERGALDIFFA